MRAARHLCWMLFFSWTPLGADLGGQPLLAEENGLAEESVLAEGKGKTLQWIEREEGWLLREGEREVLFYQRAVKSRDGRYARANYVHPLYDLAGVALTEDFPADHPHHRGVFWAWHQVWVGDKPLGDSWACRDFLWDVIQVTPHPNEAHSAAITVRVHWKSPDWTDAEGKLKPVVEETTTLRVHRADDDAQAIDFTIRLRALEENVRLGGSDDDKGYGGFSVRVRLPEGVTFTGRKGEVEPQVTSVEAGPWLDISAPYGSVRREQPGQNEKEEALGAEGQARSGVTILTHPDAPGFPQRWILRRERSMQNPVYPGREPVGLSTQEPLTLRYRLVLHRGDTDPDRIEKWFADYAKTDDRNGK